MKTRHFAVAGLTAAMLTACAATPTAEQKAAYTNDARATAGLLAQTLGGELKAAIKESGPANAVSFCKERAPKIAADVSAQKGVSVRRTTFKSRNPKSAPDAWEAAVLKDFEQRLAQGAKPTELEYAEVVSDANGKTHRYMKALVIQEPCMTCHGTKETIPAEVQAKLASEYPNDQATGYLPNMLRGAISIKKPL